MTTNTSKPILRNVQRLIASAGFASALCLAGCLTGCGTGAGTGATVSPTTAAPGGTGLVMGGQQPVANSSIVLYQAGAGGYGSAASALTAPVFTSSGGNFTFPAYTCTAGSQLYVTATGGQPIPGTTNNNLALMAGLGVCNGTYATSFVNINELTTVASVYALAPFMSGPTSIGAPVSNSLGLSNNMAVIEQLVNTTNGTISGPTLPTGAIIPTMMLNTLADILEQCVNSAGGSASDTTDGQTNGTACGKLFYLTNTGTAPTDTITATLRIAQNPSSNTTKLNLLRSASPVFTPALAVNNPPSAFSLAISYSARTGGNFASPTAIATDAAGNVYTSNLSGLITKQSFTGAPLGSTTQSTSGALAVDQAGLFWAAGANSTAVFRGDTVGATSSFNPTPATTYKALTIDGAGLVFLSGVNGVQGLTNSGAQFSGAPFTAASEQGTLGIAATPK